jgi:hypothetical protein
MEMEDFMKSGGFDCLRSTADIGSIVHILYRANQAQTRDLLKIYQRKNSVLSGAAPLVE